MKDHSKSNAKSPELSLAGWVVSVLPDTLCADYVSSRVLATRSVAVFNRFLEPPGSMCSVQAVVSPYPSGVVSPMQSHASLPSLRRVVRILPLPEEAVCRYHHSWKVALAPMAARDSSLVLPVCVLQFPRASSESSLLRTCQRTFAISTVSHG